MTTTYVYLSSDISHTANIYKTPTDAPNYYGLIDEASADDSDYLGGNGGAQSVVCGISPNIADSTDISVYINMHGRTYGGQGGSGASWSWSLSNGTNTLTGSNYSEGTSWSEKRINLPNAPDGGAWTTAKVNALTQLTAIMNGGPKGAQGQVSWLNLEIVHTISSTPAALLPMLTGGG